MYITSREGLPFELSCAGNIALVEELIATVKSGKHVRIKGIGSKGNVHCGSKK